MSLRIQAKISRKPLLSRKAFDNAVASAVVSHKKLSKATLNELAKLAGLTQSEAAEIWKDAKGASQDEPMPVIIPND
jgi:hypothetical protein